MMECKYFYLNPDTLLCRSYVEDSDLGKVCFKMQVAELRCAWKGRPDLNESTLTHRRLEVIE